MIGLVLTAILNTAFLHCVCVFGGAPPGGEEAGGDRPAADESGRLALASSARPEMAQPARDSGRVRETDDQTGTSG